MANLHRYVPSSPSQLLGHILDRPELVAAVRELPAAALSRLIGRIGLEDSGELIALASTEQLEAMFDEDLWRTDASGFEERFDPRRFALWLQVMGEAGSEFLVERLSELPLDLLTLAVNRLVLVIDMDDLLNHLAGARDEAGQIEYALENSTCEEWEEFRLVARDVDAWEDVWNALLSLDRDHHERLRAILERCCAMSTEYINGQGGLYDVLTSDEMLEGDALAERDDRRSAQGFVTPGDARGFLELARLDERVVAERDPLTAAYFRALGPTGSGAALSAGALRLAPSGSGADVQGLMQLIAASDPHAGDRITGPERVLPGSAPRARVARPGARARKESSPKPAAAALTVVSPAKSALATALATLSSEQPVVHNARMEELGYLANVLITGCKHEGRRLRPVEGLEAAIATCNLGLELWQRSEPASTLESDGQLLQHVGCDRLFRVAWAALQREVVQPAAAALAQRCTSLDAERARQAQKLIRDDVLSLRTLCQAGELDLSQEAFDALVALAEALPWQIPRQSRGGVSDAARWIGSRTDLERAQQRLSALTRAT